MHIYITTIHQARARASRLVTLDDSLGRPSSVREGNLEDGGSGEGGGVGQSSVGRSDEDVCEKKGQLGEQREEMKTRTRLSIGSERDSYTSGCGVVRYGSLPELRYEAVAESFFSTSEKSGVIERRT